MRIGAECEDRNSKRLPLIDTDDTDRKMADKTQAGKVDSKTAGYPQFSAVSSRIMLGPTPVVFLRLAAKR
jgi:hypothetical protein